MEHIKIDIIIPCFNPLIGWEKDLSMNFLELKKTLTSLSVGLVLVNDGSLKNVNTENIAYLQKQIPNFRYIDSHENKGKGYALRLGVSASDSKYTIVTDIDSPYELNSILDIYKELSQGIDVVLGSRNSDYYKKTPLIRKLISKTFRKLIKLFLSLKATDTQCGLKGFNKKGREEFLKTTINRYLFDLEFIKRCSKRKDLTISLVPVQLKDNVIFSQMNIKILLTEALNFLLILFKK